MAIKTGTKNKLLLSDSKIEEGKTTLSTGGGEPIPAGHKRTTERRVLQPRDPDTGQFDYNVSAGMERKYEYHAERNGSHNGKGGGGEHKKVPAAFKDLLFNGSVIKKGIRKGDTIIFGDKRIIASCNLSVDELKDKIEELSGLKNISSAFEDKKGRKSREEKLALAKAGVKHSYRMSGDSKSARKFSDAEVIKGANLGKNTKAALKRAAESYEAGKKVDFSAVVTKEQDATGNKGEKSEREMNYDYNAAKDLGLNMDRTGKFSAGPNSPETINGRPTEDVVKDLNDGKIKMSSLDTSDRDMDDLDTKNAGYASEGYGRRGERDNKWTSGYWKK